MEEILIRKYAVRSASWYAWWHQPYSQGVQFGLYKRMVAEWVYDAEIRWKNDSNELEMQLFGDSLVLLSQFSTLWDKITDRIVEDDLLLDDILLLLASEGFSPILPAFSL